MNKETFKPNQPMSTRQSCGEKAADLNKSFINFKEVENLWHNSLLSKKTHPQNKNKKMLRLLHVPSMCWVSVSKSHFGLQYHRPTSIAPNSEGRRNQFAALQHPQCWKMSLLTGFRTFNGAYLQGEPLKRS